jgi:hypothetical protein
MIMRKEFPSRAVRAVVFADCAPLALGKVRSPAVPVDFALTRFFETFFFSVHDVSSSELQGVTYRRSGGSGATGVLVQPARQPNCRDMTARC